MSADFRRVLLERAGETLAASLDYATTLRAVAALAVHDFADVCLVDVVDEAGIAERVAMDCRDPSVRPTLAEFMPYPVRSDRDFLSYQAMRTGRAELVEVVDDDDLVMIAQDATHLKLLRLLPPHSLLLAPLVARGQLLGILALISLSSGRRFTEEDRRLAEELARRSAVAVDNARLYARAQNAIAARDQMLAIVSHDLRNPLGTVVMSASFLRELIPAENSALVRQLDIINRATGRMNRMIEDLLDVARLEAGRLSLDLAPVPAAALLSEGAELLRPLAAEQGIALLTEWDDALATVTADRGRILQVLSNLGSNAVKFTPRGGQITLAALSDGDMIQVSVTDTGLGISPEHVPRLFDRFWQATRNDRRGIGLGLSIVQGIIADHGGRLWVESTPGKGSVFRFTLPVTVSPGA